MPLESAAIVAEEKHKEVESLPTYSVDRERTCPMLLRVFVNYGRHSPLNDYARGNTPANELQIYTWMDCSLKELTSLVKEVHTDARRRGTFFDFSVVTPEIRTPTYRMRDIGCTQGGRKCPDDPKTLHDAKFNIGDYIDVAITPPSGPMAGRPMGGMPPGRGGGYYR